MLRNLLILATTAFLTACELDLPVDIPLKNQQLLSAAMPYVGMHENNNRTELRTALGVDPVRTEWCAAFMNTVLADAGMDNLIDTESEYPLMARSFLDWGTKISTKDIKMGDLVIFRRGTHKWQGHVGIYLGETVKNGVRYFMVFGGNQNDQVGAELYRTSKLLGVRRP